MYSFSAIRTEIVLIYNIIFYYLSRSCKSQSGNESSTNTTNNVIFFSILVFYFQIQDAKDLHHLSLVGSYGAHLLHGFPPHFLHPAVTSANSATSPFSGGGAFVKPFPSNLPLPSAFAPPPKCVGLGLEQVTIKDHNYFNCFCFYTNFRANSQTNRLFNLI